MADGVGGADRTDAADRADGAAAGEATIREQARDLRRAGRSVAQIATTLGGVPTSTVQSWVVGVPPPSWTRRPRAKDAERERARQLRREGSTYDEIARQLSVSKSSVSLWTRDLPHPEPSPEGLDARAAGHRRYFADRREHEDRRREHELDAVAASFGPLSERDLLVGGAVAYWAEGTKRKPWRPGERVTFINSDLDMIRLFLAFLQLMDVDDERLRFRLSIHESADVEAASQFWADSLGLEAGTFQRPTLKRHVPGTQRKNVGESYHGCLVVGVLRSAPLYRQIEGVWRGIGLSTRR